MQLTQTQIEQFDRDGYLFFPSLFTPEEIRVLIDEVPYLYAQHRPENVREKGSDAVRTNFAAHMYSKPFAKLARHPRMVRAGHADLWRARVHAPVQDQRQNGLRGRPLAVAPGLWYLEERRPHA